MKNRLNEGIIVAIRNHLSQNEQIAPLLMDMLCLGKEAIYRRLRGEVAFTFDEVATISTKMGFSIDTLAGLRQSERVIFDAALYDNLPPQEIYYNKMLDYKDMFSELLKSKVVTGRFVNNHLPLVFSIYYESLSKFRYFKWLHQKMGIDSDCKMEDVVMPEKIINVLKIWTEVTTQQTMHAIYIFDNHLFSSLCRDIEFYRSNNLLNDSEVESLRSDLNKAVDKIEAFTSSGETPSGAPIHFYLLPFDLGSNYMHFEYDGNVACYTHIHSIDHLQSNNSHVCDMHKNWIDQIRRHAVFITQSGEMVRLTYFKKQREYIANIGKHNSHSQNEKDT